MKTLWKTILFLVIIGTFSYSIFLLVAGPCYAPKEYSMGVYDERFSVTEAEFIAAAQAAEKIWEDAIGKDLFSYSESGDLAINLIFDERQETALKNKSLESKVDATENSAKSIRAQFEDLRNRYESESASYSVMADEYKMQQEAYSNNVDYWNDQGGAPKKEYEDLQRQKSALQIAQGTLEAKRIKVNSLATEVNNLVSKYNYLVNQANSDIEKINQTADKEFEQGEYVSSGINEQINIYEFYTKDELVRILAHEFGHALGADHNDNPDSILYYLNEGTGLTASAEDIRDIKKVCRMK